MVILRDYCGKFFHGVFPNRGFFTGLLELFPNKPITHIYGNFSLDDVIARSMFLRDEAISD